MTNVKISLVLTCDVTNLKNITIPHFSEIMSSQYDVIKTLKTDILTEMKQEIVHIVPSSDDV